MLTKISGINNNLLADKTVTWNGTKTSDTVEVPVEKSFKLGQVLVKIDNNDQAQDLTVTFEYEVAADVWMQWYDKAGSEIKFTAKANTRLVYGPFEGFPRYLSGRIKLTAASAPTNTKTTVVQVQEI